MGTPGGVAAIRLLVVAFWLGWACLGWAGPAAAQGAAGNDVQDCNQFDDLNRTIRGCTALLRQGVGNTAVVFARLAEAHRRLGNFEQAIADATAAIRLDPNYAWAHAIRAEAHRRRGGGEEAMRDYTRALEIDPNMASVWNNRGVLLSERGDFDGAIRDLTRALEVRPRFALALRNRAEAYWRAGRAEEARRDDLEARRLAEDRLSSSPNDAMSLYIRGSASLRLGDRAGAETDLSAAVNQDPRYPWSRIWLGHVQREAGQWHAAVAAYDEALALARGLGEAWWGRGLAYEAMGDVRRAVADLREAVRLGFALARSDLARVEAALRAPVSSTANAGAPPAATAGSVTQTGVSVVKPPTPEQRQERRVALVIGNAAYRHAPVIENALRDAATMAQLFRDLRFDQVVVHTDLRRDGMVRALQEFERLTQQADWVVIYFSGHGVEVGGRNYLIPIDADLRSPQDVEDFAMGLDRVLERTSAARGLRLVILDACRDNPFLGRMTAAAGTKSVGTKGLAPLENDALSSGTMVVYAARAGQVAQQGEEGGVSPFVEALSRRLREPNLEINLAFRRVRDDVLARTHRRQEPVVYQSLPGEEFFLIRR